MSDLAGIGSFMGSLANAGANVFSTWQQNAVNKQIASQNLQFQYKNLDYLKRVQQKTWDREDTAMQRRMADLRQAGLNPYLAASGNGAGAGAVIKTEAPHNDYQADFSGFRNILGNFLNGAIDMYKSLQQVKQEKLYTQYMKMKNDEQYLNNIGLGNALDKDWLFINPATNKYELYRFDKGYSSEQMGSLFKTSLAMRQREDSLARINEMLKQYPMQTEMLQTQRDFAVSDKIEGYIMDSINALVSGSNAARKWYEFQNRDDYHPLQNYQRDSYRDRNGVYHERKSYY